MGCGKKFKNIVRKVKRASSKGTPANPYVVAYSAIKKATRKGRKQRKRRG